VGPSDKKQGVPARTEIVIRNSRERVCGSCGQVVHHQVFSLVLFFLIGFFPAGSIGRYITLEGNMGFPQFADFHRLQEGYLFQLSCHTIIYAECILGHLVLFEFFELCFFCFPEKRIDGSNQELTVRCQLGLAGPFNTLLFKCFQVQHLCITVTFLFLNKVRGIFPVFTHR